jgi:hypothetical protein
VTLTQNDTPRRLFAAVALLAVAMLFAARAWGVPDSQPLPLADPSGVWLAHVGTDTTARYRVQIGRDADGVLITRWATLGDDPRLHYAGKLAEVKGEWIETYSDGPNLMHSRPWHWRVYSERPLLFVDDDTERGWTLSPDKGDVLFTDPPPDDPAARPAPKPEALKFDWHPDILNAGKEVGAAAKQVATTGRQIEKTAVQVERTGAAVERLACASERAVSVATDWAPSVFFTLAMLAAAALFVWFVRRPTDRPTEPTK